MLLVRHNQCEVDEIPLKKKKRSANFKKVTLHNTYGKYSIKVLKIIRGFRRKGKKNGFPKRKLRNQQFLSRGPRTYSVL